VGWGERRGMSGDNNLSQLPPQTTCARCEREIESQIQDRYRHRWIEVRDLLTDTIRYYHHSCYNSQMKPTPTKGR